MSFFLLLTPRYIFNNFDFLRPSIYVINTIFLLLFLSLILIISEYFEVIIFIFYHYFSCMCALDTTIEGALVFFPILFSFFNRNHFKPQNIDLYTFCLQHFFIPLAQLSHRSSIVFSIFESLRQTLPLYLLGF